MLTIAVLCFRFQKLCEHLINSTLATSRQSLLHNSGLIDFLTWIALFFVLSFNLLFMILSRSYRCGDDRLLEMADVIQKSFNVYNARFLEEHTLMSQSWLGDLIVAARQARRDQRERASLRHQTMDMLEMMSVCRELIRKVELFAEDAFADDPAVLEEFDFKGLRENARTQAGLIVQMEFLADKAEDFRDALSAAGAPERLFDTLAEVAEGVFETNSEQEMSKRLRVQHTRERIEVMNALWDGLVKIEKLSKMMFKGEEELLRLFVVPRYKRRLRSVASEVADGSVEAEAAE